MWARSHAPEERRPAVKGALRKMTGAVEKIPLGAVGLDLLQKFAQGVTLIQPGRQAQQGRLEAASKARILAPTDAIQAAFDSHQRITIKDEGEVQEAPVLEVRVARTEDRKDSSGKTYCAFVLECRFQKHLWYVERRFSHFFALDQELRRIMGWEHSRLLPAMPPRTLFGMSNDAINSQRRQQLNEYISSLCELAAHGPDVYRRDEDACEAISHVPKQLYSFVDFLHFVLPTAEQERLESQAEGAASDEPDPEDTADPADPRHPTLVRALTKLKKTKEKLADEQLKMKSDAIAKHSLVQQLTEKQEKRRELLEQIADGDTKLEQLLQGPGAKIEEALRLSEARELLHAGKAEALSKCGRGASVVAGLQAMQASGLYGARGNAMAHTHVQPLLPLKEPKWQRGEETAYYLAMQMVEERERLARATLHAHAANAHANNAHAHAHAINANAHANADRPAPFGLNDPDLSVGRAVPTAVVHDDPDFVPRNQRRLGEIGGHNDPEPVRRGGRVEEEEDDGRPRGLVGGGGDESVTIREVAGHMLAENARVWRAVVKLAMQREKATRALHDMQIPSALHAWEPKDLLRFTCLHSAPAPHDPLRASNSSPTRPSSPGAPSARPRSQSPRGRGLGRAAGGGGGGGKWDWRSRYQRMAERWGPPRGRTGGVHGAKSYGGVGGVGFEDLAEGVGSLGRGLEEAVYLMASELEDALAEQSRQAQELKEAQELLDRLQEELCLAEEQRDDALAREAAAKEGKKMLVIQERLLSVRLDAHNDPELHRHTDADFDNARSGRARPHSYGAPR